MAHPVRDKRGAVGRQQHGAVCKTAAPLRRLKSSTPRCRYFHRLPADSKPRNGIGFSNKRHWPTARGCRTLQPRLARMALECERLVAGGALLPAARISGDESSIE